MNKQKQYLAAFGVGLLFAIGLGVSGMTLPSKVIGFLDFTGGTWDPALAFVMGGGVLVYALGYRLVTKRPAPIFAEKFALPTRRDIDFRLVAGAFIFGAGWGLGGLCPGPAITSVATLSPKIITFVVSMFSGMYLFSVVDKAVQKRKATIQSKIVTEKKMVNAGN